MMSLILQMVFLLVFAQVLSAEELCKTQGRFAVENDVTCRKYYICSLLNGEFQQINYDCSENSYFHPEKGLCTTNYDCINGTLTPIVTALQEEILPEVNCTGMSFGPHANVYDVDCKEYFYCSKLKNGSYKITKFYCRNNLVYDPVNVICSWSYVCPFKIATTPLPTESSSFYESTNFGEGTSNTEIPENEINSETSLGNGFTNPLTTTEVGNVQEGITTLPTNLIEDCTNSLGSTEVANVVESSSPEETTNSSQIIEDVKTTVLVNEEESVTETTGFNGELTETTTAYETTEQSDHTANTVEVDTAKTMCQGIVSNKDEIIVDPETCNFSCVGRGYYKDPFDNSCNSFIFCDVTIENLYGFRLKCPDKFNFDPVTKLCTYDSNCSSGN